jgi:hypothetical protein
MPVRLIRSEVSVFFGLQVEPATIHRPRDDLERMPCCLNRTQGRPTRTLMQIVVIFDSDSRNESPEDLITILAG